MTPSNAVIQSEMKATTTGASPETYREKELRVQIARFLETWNYDTIHRFARKYGKAKTRRGYLADLDLYFRWLSSVGVSLNPDELIKDNLSCVFESGPTEIGAKRKHTDLLDRYVNVFLLEQGVCYSTRHRKAAAIRQFYKRNDSLLYGDFSLSEGSLEPRKKTPSAEDIREVIKALPIQQKVPLVLIWQTGMEPATALALKWGDVKLEGAYIRLDFLGRKSHKVPYFKLAGRESIQQLKMWRQKRVEDMEREPGPGDLIFYGKRHGPMAPGWLNSRFKKTAMRLFKQGLIREGERDSWHIYALRHSFSTECSHADVKQEVREFWMGHVTAISWVYQHPELHEPDFVAEYQKVEPYLSLNPSEVVVEERVKVQFEGRLESLERQMLEYASKGSAGSP